MTQWSLSRILLLGVALTGACGGDGGVGPAGNGVGSGPDAQKPAAIPVLAKLEVTPGSSTLIQGDTRQLVINAWDQFGTKLLNGSDAQWADKARFVSSDPRIARVSAIGEVIAQNPGVARITASLTLGDSTLTGSMTAQVDAPTATSVVLTADGNRGWSPYTVTLKAPATVTWVVPAGVQAPTIWLDVWVTNTDTVAFTNGVATRTFTTPGMYYYGTGGGLMWYEEGGRILVF